MEFDITPMMVLLVPLTIAVVGVIKLYTGSYWAPLMSLCAGVVLCLIFSSALDMTLGQRLIGGLMIGAAAAGTFDVGKRMWKAMV